MGNGLKSLRRQFYRQQIVGIAVFFVVAAIGVAFLVVSHAASPYASGEAANGTLAGGASVISDPNASDGSAVQFGSGSVSSNGCGLAQVAFCDTFTAPAGIGNRSGELNGTVWGVSRITGNEDPDSQIDDWATPNCFTTDDSCTTPITGDYCGNNNTVMPDSPTEPDVQVCNGRLVESQNDGGTVTGLDIYPKQPFNFAGRTGTVTFQVSDDSQGTHAAWPEFWMTDTPIPDPLVHENATNTGFNIPANGFGVRFAANCSPGQGGNCGSDCSGNNTSTVVTVDSAIVIQHYITSDTFFGPNSEGLKVNPMGCMTEADGPGQENTIVMKVNTNEIDVYGTNAGTTSPLIELATITNANLTFTQGLIWLVDAHYNADKFNSQRINTFTWGNVGFDGPVEPRDLAFDVLDNNAPGGTTQGGTTGINLGWAVPTTTSGVSLPIFGNISSANIAAASKALLCFAHYALNTGANISYNLNGKGWNTVPWPAVTDPDGNPTDSATDTATVQQYGSICTPVSLSDVVTGNNTVAFNSDQGGVMVMNIDLVLAGAGGVVSPSTPID